MLVVHVSSVYVCILLELLYGVMLHNHTYVVEGDTFVIPGCMYV